jgi:hypothetical protein
MLVRKTLKNFADAAGFGKHLPDFGCDLVKVKIRTGTHAQDNRAAVDVCRGQFVVPYNDAFNGEGQAARLHCCAGSQLTSVRSGSANFIVRYGKTLEKPSRMQNQASSRAATAAVARQDLRRFRCEMLFWFPRRLPPSLRLAAPRCSCHRPGQSRSIPSLTSEKFSRHAMGSGPTWQGGPICWGVRSLIAELQCQPARADAESQPLGIEYSA